MKTPIGTSTSTAISAALGLAVAMSLALTSSSALAATKKKKAAKPAPVEECVQGKVLSAMQLRIIQTELMVAGLSCRGLEQWSQTANIKLYNDFVMAYRPTLMNDAHKVLARHFKTEQRLNDYLTRLANDASQRSLKNIAIFCIDASKTYGDVLATPNVDLASYSAAMPISSTHGQKVCGGATTAAIAPAPSAASAGGTVVASNVTTPAPLPAQSSDTSTPMQPVIEASMRAAVKKPPVPQLKPNVP